MKVLFRVRNPQTSKTVFTQDPHVLLTDCGTIITIGTKEEVQDAKWSMCGDADINTGKDTYLNIVELPKCQKEIDYVMETTTSLEEYSKGKYVYI